MVCCWEIVPNMDPIKYPAYSKYYKRQNPHLIAIIIQRHYKSTLGLCLKSVFHFRYIYCMPKACYFVLCPSIRAHKPSPENTEEQPLGWAGRVGDVDHWSTFLTRSTTGTEVHGIIPSSVMTRSTKSGGVTSYTKFSRPSEGTSCQCSSWVFPVRVTMRSSGSSGKDGWWIQAGC